MLIGTIYAGDRAKRRQRHTFIARIGTAWPETATFGRRDGLGTVPSIAAMRPWLMVVACSRQAISPRV